MHGEVPVDYVSSLSSVRQPFYIVGVKILQLPLGNEDFDLLDSHLSELPVLHFHKCIVQNLHTDGKELSVSGLAKFSQLL